MLRRVGQRWFSRPIVPHPLFESDHPMVKEDEQIKSIRFLKKTGQLRLPQAEPVDVTSSEYNTPSVRLYEVTKADLQDFSEQVEVYTLIYMNHNYEEIEKMLGHVSPLQFDKRVQKLPKMSRNLLYQEVIHTENTSYEYIVSRFCPPHFKSFMDTLLTIAPVYGMVMPLSESPQFEDTWKQLHKLTHIFFNGAGTFLTPAHRWRYRSDLMCQGINGEFSLKCS